MVPSLNDEINFNEFRHTEEDCVTIFGSPVEGSVTVNMDHQILHWDWGKSLFQQSFRINREESTHLFSLLHTKETLCGYWHYKGMSQFFYDMNEILNIVEFYKTVIERT